MVFEERKRRKADRMVIRKMRIDHDQLEDILKKELMMSDAKLKQQIEAMSDMANALLNKQIKQILTPE